MIPVGDKLGGKYFVLAPIDTAQLDVLHEVRDSQGTVSYAQCLLDAPLPPSSFEALRSELAAIPASRLYRRPDEVVRSGLGVPFAIFRQEHPPALTQRLPALFTGEMDERRRAALRALVTWFAPLAEELNNLHAVGIIHGAISIDRLFVTDDRGAERLGLSGFGSEAASRLAAGRSRPTPRADFAALALALHAAMERTGARPDGAAVVRWEMIRNCARAGDHPALQSGLALANAIRQLIDEPARRISGGTLTAVGSAANAPGTSGVDRGGPGSPAGGGSGSGAGAPGAPPALLTSAFGALAASETVHPARRRRIVLVAAVACAVIATAAIVTLTGQSPPPDTGVALRVRVSMPTRCGDEPLAPPVAVAVASEPSDLGSLCLGDAQEVAVLAHVDDSLVLGRRRNTRGSRFDEPPAVVATGVLQAGTSISGPVGWTTWIAREGPVFRLARLDRQVHPIPTRTPGLVAAAFRGSLLLRADATGAWIATTFLVGGRERAAVVELAAARNDEPRVATVYVISGGAVVAAIPGDPATLLLREEADGRTTFTAVSLPLNTLAGLSAVASSDGGGAAEGDGGSTAVRELSAQVLQRSAAWVAPGATTRFAALGVGAAGSSRRFLATVASGADGACGDDRCDGAVLVLEIPPRGAAVTQEVEANGRGEMIAYGVNNTVVVAVRRAGDGALVPHVLDVSSAGRPRHWVLGGLDHTSVVNCGDEPWLAFAQGSPQLRLGAIPLACALR